MDLLVNYGVPLFGLGVWSQHHQVFSLVLFSTACCLNFECCMMNEFRTGSHGGYHCITQFDLIICIILLEGRLYHLSPPKKHDIQWIESLMGEVLSH